MALPIPKKPGADSCVEYARDILRAEGDAIRSAAELIDENFDHAVQLIVEIAETGRLVTTGMGKAGFIAQKISATFASTGLPSYYLHPAEAIHGDLGRFTEKDIVLILSNSGETEEILRMLPTVKRMGCPVISFTSKAECSIARHSDITLPIGEWEEAGPFGLAPTTSTAVMLAMGDALAMAVLRRQGFSKEKFAFYHPGGNLGRSLLLVSEIMRSGEEHCVVEETLLTRTVLQRITSTKGRPGAATIVNAKGALTGIFTDGDLRRCLAERSEFLDLPVKEVMGKNPKTIPEQHLAQEAMQILTHHRIDQVIVVNAKNQPVGLLDIQDLMAVRTR